MKGLNTLFFFLLFGWSAYSQSYNFTWQAIIRDDSGTVWTDKELRLKWSILNEQMALRYAEEHKVFTNSQGLITLKIGNGENREGSLDRIDWSKEKLIIRFELDLTAGRQFKNAMNHPISVMPYAINAFSADSIKGSTSLSSIAGNGSFLYYDGQKWAGFPIGKPGQFLATNATGELAWGNPGTIPKLGELSVRHTGNDSLFIKSSVEQGSATGLLSRGLVWDTLPEPTIKANNIRLEANPGISIDAILSKWISGKKYYIRAFATNAYGTGYSAHRTFEPGGEKCKDGDKLTLSSFHGDTIDIGMPLSFWVEEYDNLHSLNYELNGTKYESSTYREDLENPGIDYWVRTEAFHKSGCRMLSDTLRFKVLDLSKEVNVISNLIISTNSGEKIYSYSTVDEIDVTGKNSWQIKVDDSMGSDIVFLGRRKEGLEDENLGLTYAVPGRDTLYFSAENTAYALLYLHAASRKKTTLPAMETFMKSKSDFTTLINILDKDLNQKGSLDLFSEEKNSLVVKLLDEWLLFPGSVENIETDEQPKPLFKSSQNGITLEYDSGGKPFYYMVQATHRLNEKLLKNEILFRNTGSGYNTDLLSLIIRFMMDNDTYRTPDVIKGIKTIGLNNTELNLPDLKQGEVDSFLMVIESGLNHRAGLGNPKAALANVLDLLYEVIGISPVGSILKALENIIQNPCAFSVVEFIYNSFSDMFDLLIATEISTREELQKVIYDFFTNWMKKMSSFILTGIKENGCLKSLIPDHKKGSIKENLKLVDNFLKIFNWVQIGKKYLGWVGGPTKQEQTFYFNESKILQSRIIITHNFNEKFFGVPGFFLSPNPSLSIKQHEYVSKEYYRYKLDEKVGNLIPSTAFLPFALSIKVGENTEYVELNGDKKVSVQDQEVALSESENIWKWKIGTQVNEGQNKYMGSIGEYYKHMNDEDILLPIVLTAKVGKLQLKKQPYQGNGLFKVLVTDQDDEKRDGVEVIFEVLDGDANLITYAPPKTGRKISVISNEIGECSVNVNQVAGIPLRIRAKIVNSNEDSQTTAYFPDPPKLTSFPIKDITSSSATSGGNILSSGEGEIKEVGVIWSTSPNPAYAFSTKTKDGNTIGPFESKLTNLLEDTTYYVRAYATNSEGAVGYGEEFSFSTLKDFNPCPGFPVMEDLDGNVYATVKIGTQCWMRENLRVTRYQDGSPIFMANDLFSWSQRKEVNAIIAGAMSKGGKTINGKEEWFYNAYAANDYRGLCPTGWRVPSVADWQSMISLLGGLEVAGGKLKAIDPSWEEPNVGADNESGFSALPVGGLSPDGVFDNFGKFAGWWSKPSSLTEARLANISNGSTRIILTSYRNASLNTGGSVRCLR